MKNEPRTAPHLFQAVPNALLSPHIGGVTADAGTGTGAAKNILDVLHGPIRRLSPKPRQALPVTPPITGSTMPVMKLEQTGEARKT
ncbi:hypothetical protein [Noviherbaspirillum humi]|uniref:hypothetical protein n=1 Tax=Noviherbaspirillum humi TaxID=1688639 RepID=UPI0011603FE5|nr:hypothetical protein [Noviherbaspirillum humi]